MLLRFLKKKKIYLKLALVFWKDFTNSRTWNIQSRMFGWGVAGGESALGQIHLPVSPRNGSVLGRRPWHASFLQLVRPAHSEYESSDHLMLIALNSCNV